MHAKAGNPGQTVESPNSYFAFDGGSPVFRFLRRTLKCPGTRLSTLKRILILFALTWFPLLLLSILQGGALEEVPRKSFLLDLATHARFFLAIPIFIAAEGFISPRIRKAQAYFWDSGLVRREDIPEFEDALRRAQKRTESMLAEIILIGMVLLIAWLTYSTFRGARVDTWQFSPSGDGFRFSLAGLWYYVVAIPILQFVMVRWLWRLLIWGAFLHSMSKLKLRLVATHPDQAGGLAFLGLHQVSFGILFLGFGSIISAAVAFRMIFEGATIDSFQILIISYLVVFELIFLGPLLLFVPVLVRARREGLQTYATLANRYNLSFHEKWVEGNSGENEALLGTSDIQSLADLGASFQMIRQMRIAPFSLRNVIQMAVYAAFPLLPLLPLIMPVADILRLLARMLL